MADLIWAWQGPHHWVCQGAVLYRDSKRPGFRQQWRWSLDGRPARTFEGTWQEVTQHIEAYIIERELADGTS